MVKDDFSLYHCYRNGDASINGLIDDYAFLLKASIDLYEATLDSDYLKFGKNVCHKMINLFWDNTKGSFYATPIGSVDVIVRQKNLLDGAIPSGNSVAVSNLFRLAKITGNTKWSTLGEKTLKAFTSQAKQSPSGFSFMLTGFMFNQMNSKELVKMLGKSYKNPDVNLDIDFSVSRGGYRLRPHRDDVTRLYNFLIYLNDISEKNGGSLTIFKKKADMKLRKSFKRFPSISELTKVKEFTPSRGSVIFFQSTPNSYHGVTLFREEKGKKRFFIYGSYALSKPVVWKYKNVSYLPKIKKTNKKLLTSSHDSDYFLKEAG